MRDERDAASAAPTVAFVEKPEGYTQAQVLLGDEMIGDCAIFRLTHRIGAATVQVDSIGGVWTNEEHRQKGYARRMLETTIARLTAGDAALSWLFGIPGFYHRFDYAPVGDFTLRLTNLERETPLPVGWCARPFAAADLPAVRALYDRVTATAIGPILRSEGPGWDGRVWASLVKLAAETTSATTASGESVAGPTPPVGELVDSATATTIQNSQAVTPPAGPVVDGATAATDEPAQDAAAPDACHVLEDAAGRIGGYVWRGKGFWSVDANEKNHPEALAIAEVIADSPAAADAALAVCRAWGRAESARRDTPVTAVIVGTPPDGAVAAAARLQDAELRTIARANAGPMLRLLDAGRLIAALEPELATRFRAAGVGFTGTLRLDTGASSAALQLDRTGARAIDTADASGAVAATLPAATLAQLAFGAFKPSELLARLERPVDDRAAELLAALFPRRDAYTYWADRV